MDRGTLRGALRHFALTPASRQLDRPAAVAAALRWLERASLPVGEVSKPQHARAVLDAISVTQDGRAASATTIARKRSVFANVIRYAVEPEELPSNPLDRLSWKPPKVSEVVDRRVVVNPRQARDPYIAPFAVWSYDDNATALLGAGHEHREIDPAAAPGRLEDAAGLPPAYIEVGQLDIFRDEAIGYALTLSRAGVPGELHLHPGVPHEYDAIAFDADVSHRAQNDRDRVLRSL